MTAEIAVANKWGVALAADSAVTTEQFHKNKIVEKVYNSANKLGASKNLAVSGVF